MASGTLKGITIEIGGETTELTKALSDVGGRAREAGSELRAVENALKFNPGNVELLAQRERYAAEQASALRDRLDLVNRALSSGQVERGSKAYDRLRRELITTTDRIERLDAKAGEARRALERAGDGARSASGDVDALGDAASRASERLEPLREVATGTFLSLGEDALDAARSAVSSVAESAASWDAATARMEAAVGGVAGEAERLEGVGRSLYSEGWGDSLGQLTDAAISAREVLGDLSEEDLSAVTEAALGLEEVFGSDVQETLRGVNVLTERFGLSAAEATDLMVAGAQRGLDYTDELGDNVAEYAGRWGDAGVSASEYFSLLQAGVDAGAYSLDRVGDYLNEFLTSLSDGRMAESVGSLSRGTQELWDSYREGGATALDMLDAVIGDLEGCASETERASVASELWGTLGEDNAMSVILALGDVEDSYGDVAGSAEGLADTVEDTFDKRMAASVRRLQGAFEPLALAGMDALTGLLEGAQPAIDAFASLDAGTQALVVSMVAVAPAASKAVRALNALEGTSKVIGGVSKAIGGVSAGIAGLGLAALVGVVGMVADEIGKANEAAEEAARRASDLQAVTEGVAGALDGVDASTLSGVAEAASEASGVLAGAADDASALAARVQEGYGRSGEILADAAQSFRDVARSLAETDASSAEVESLAATIDRLRDTEGLAEDQQIELESAVRRFNDATGASIEVVDSHNGALSETPDRIDAICDAYVREAKAAALSQGLVDLYRVQADQQEALRESTQDVADACVLMWQQMAGADVVEDFARFMGTTVDGLGQTAAASEDLTGHLQTMRDALWQFYNDEGYASDGLHLWNEQASDATYVAGLATGSVNDMRAALDGTNGQIADLEGRLHDVVAGAGEGAQSLEELTDGAEGAGDAASGASDGLSDMGDGLRAALEGCRGAVDGVDDLAGALEDASKTAEGAGDSIERAFDAANDDGADIVELTREVNEALQEAGVTTDDLSESMVLLAYNSGVTGDGLVDLARRWQEGLDAQREAQEAAEEAEEERRRAVEETLESMSELVAEAPAVADAIGAAGRSAGDFALWLDSAGSSVDEFRARFESLAGVSNPLSAIEQETGVYTWQMRDNLQSNIDAANQWSADMAELYSRVTNEEELAFARYVESMGADNAEFLHYLLYDADVPFDQLSAKYAEAQRAQADAAVSITEEGAAAAARVGVDVAGEGADASVDALAGGLEEGVPQAETSGELLGDATMETLMGLPGEMRARGEAAGGMLAVGLAQGTATVPSGVSSVVGLVASELAPMPRDMGLLGESAGASLAAGLASGAAPSAEAASSLSSSCASALSAFPSDMSVAGELGGESFAGGVSSGGARSGEAARALATACGSALSPFPSQMRAAGSSGGKAFGDGVQLQMGHAYSSAWNLAGAALSAMSTMTASAYASGAELGGNFAAGIASQVDTAALAASSVAGAVSDRLHFSEPKLGPLVGINDSGAEMVSNFARSMLSEVPALEVASEAAARAARVAPADPGWSPYPAQDQGRATDRAAPSLTKADVYDAMRAAIRAEVGGGGLSVLMDGRRVGELVAPHVDRELSAIEARRSR